MTYDLLACVRLDPAQIPQLGCFSSAEQARIARGRGLVIAILDEPEGTVYRMLWTGGHEGEMHGSRLLPATLSQ